MTEKLRRVFVNRDWIVARALIENDDVGLDLLYDLGYDGDMTCLHFAILNNAPLDLVQLLMSKRQYDLNRKSRLECGILYATTSYPMIKFLLENGVDPNACSYTLPDHIDHAHRSEVCLYREIRTTLLLLKFGADLNAVVYNDFNVEGRTILQQLRVKIGSTDLYSAEYIARMKIMYDLLIHTQVLLALVQPRRTLLPVDMLRRLKVFLV